MEAPPTPPVTLTRLLADHELGLRHLAGPAEAELHGVHASEMPDPSPYLLGGELLLTAGTSLTEPATWPTADGRAGAWPGGDTEPAAGGRAEPSGAGAWAAGDTEPAAGGRTEPSGADASPTGDTEPAVGSPTGTSGAGAWAAGDTEPSGVEAWSTREADHATGGQAQPSGAGGGPAGAGLAGVRPGHGGAGHADSGHAHTGAAGTNPVGTDPASAGHAGPGHAGAGHPGAGPADAGHAGPGHTGAGHAGTGHVGAGLVDAGPYVARLVRAGVGAIGFGVTPVYTTVPQSLVEACDRYGLPLVEVPPGTPFTAVGRSVWRLMARARTAELRRVTEAQQSLAAAAARPDPVPAVLRRLAATLGGWAGLLPAARPDAPSTTGAGPAAGAGIVRPAPTGAGAGPWPSAEAGTVRPAPTGTGAGPAPDAGASTARPASATAGAGPSAGATAMRPTPTGTGAGPAPTAGAGTVRPAPTGAGTGPTPVPGASAVRPTPTGAGPTLTPTPGASTLRPTPAGTGTGAGPASTTPEGPDSRRESGFGAGAVGPTLGGPGRIAPAVPGASAGAAPDAEVLDVLGALARRVAPGSAVTATAAHEGLHLSVHALGDGWVLALATPTRAPGDHTVASVAAVLLTLLTARRPAGAEAAALTRLLLGGDPAGALGPGPWYAVHARGTGDPRALAAALGTVLLDPRGDSVGEDSAHVGPAHVGPAPVGPAPVGPAPADSVRLLTEREPGPQPGWRLGVSAPTRPEGLPGADAQAGRALERAEAARTPLARHTEPGLAGLVGAAEARAHAEALLGPLSPALRETLRAWLAHHGSWDRSAAALGIHRNTVRQRIARAAALLGSDLDDPDTRMELWFALRHSDGPDAP